MKLTPEHVSWFVFLASFAILLTGVCPGIYWGDDGLLITSSVTHGLGHAPGHPLYMMANRIAMALPLGDVAFRFNLSSAFWLSLAIAVFGLMAAKTVRLPEIQPAVPILVGLFMMSHCFTWHQAVRAETYALHLAMLSLALFCTVFLSKGYGLPAGAFLAALMLGNQLFLASLAGPGLIWVWFRKWFRGKYKARIMILSMAVFILGLSLFAYPWFRADVPAGQQWTLLDSPGAYFDYISARIYRQGFSEGTGTESTGPFGARLQSLLVHLTAASGWVMPMLFLLGGITVVTGFRRRAAEVLTPCCFIVLMTIIGAAACANFDVKNWDFQGYLLPVVGCMPVCAAGSLNLLQHRKSSHVQIAMAVLFGIAVLPLLMPSIGGNRLLGRRIEPGLAGRCALDSPVFRSTVLTRSDFKYILDYLCTVERYRDDLRPVSRNFIIRNAGKPALIQWMDPWQSPPVTPGTVIHYDDYIRQWLRINPSRPVAWELADDNGIIDGMNCQLGSWFVHLRSDPVPDVQPIGRCSELLRRVFSGAASSALTDVNAVEQLYTVFYNRGTFCLKRDALQLAVSQLKTAVTIDPGQAKGQNNLGVALARLGQYDKAEQAFLKVLDLQPEHPGARQNLEAVRREK